MITRIYKARNLVEMDNNILVEWRQLGKPVQSAVCGSEKCYRKLIRQLKRQGYVNVNSLI